ncbi:hypothetical protein CXY01_23170 [Cellulomonas xylanilytica]|uniref:Uncharacterized protein n=1 Tax=Cellulomonas xylanilytica TaxID=233583 RepID=A0A510V4J4_9CELL|nr:hypothetical protein CXY01_23170 [Cellulomonas xylanilytica]
MFLRDLPALESLSLINVRVDDARALAEVGTLRRLFLNGIKPTPGWDFLAGLAQIEELQILNVRGPLVLPDLSGLDRLATFRIWGCRGLTDVSVLENTPLLEEVELVDAGLTPDDLGSLLEKSTLAYLSCTFATRRDTDRFHQDLDRYGKKEHGDTAP